MGKPGARRLMDNVKKKKNSQWKKHLMKMIPGTSSSFRRQNEEGPSDSAVLSKKLGLSSAFLGLTCLIQEKDVLYVFISFYDTFFLLINYSITIE